MSLLGQAEHDCALCTPHNEMWETGLLSEATVRLEPSKVCRRHGLFCCESVLEAEVQQSMQSPSITCVLHGVCDQVFS